MEEKLKKDINLNTSKAEFSDCKWVDLNKKYSDIWPNITQKRENDVPADQQKWRDVNDKLKYFSKNPGKGD